MSTTGTTSAGRTVALAVFVTGYPLFELHRFRAEGTGAQAYRTAVAMKAPKSFTLGTAAPFGRSGLNEAQVAQVSLVRTGLTQAALPLLLLFLLTRPQMQSLFAARPRRPRVSGAVG